MLNIGTFGLSLLFKKQNKKFEVATRATESKCTSSYISENLQDKHSKVKIPP